MSSLYGYLSYEFKQLAEHPQDQWGYRVEVYDTEGSFENFTIEHAPPEPISITRAGQDKDSWDSTILLSQQLTFRFYVTYNDLQVIDPILCSPLQALGNKSNTT